MIPAIDLELFAANLKLIARQFVYDGTLLTAHVLASCRDYHAPTGSLLIYTKESGYHSGGWWKNPDYERCWHLSMSFRDPETLESAPFSKKLAAKWVELFFGKDKDKLWCEPPAMKIGKKLNVMHYRLFCDPIWIPLKPRGEVYNKHLTERGWKSFSELHTVEK